MYQRVSGGVLNEMAVGQTTLSCKTDVVGTERIIYIYILYLGFSLPLKELSLLKE